MLYTDMARLVTISDSFTNINFFIKCFDRKTKKYTTVE